MAAKKAPPSRIEREKGGALVFCVGAVLTADRGLFIGRAGAREIIAMVGEVRHGTECRAAQRVRF